MTTSSAKARWNPLTTHPPAVNASSAHPAWEMVALPWLFAYAVKCGGGECGMGPAMYVRT